MQPARLDLSIIKGATLRLVLRIMQPRFEYRAIAAISDTAPVRLTVAHDLAVDWPAWVRGVSGMQALNTEPAMQRPHMVVRVDASTLEINRLSATGLRPAGGELVYHPPVDLTGAVATLMVLDNNGTQLLGLAPTVHAAGWVEVVLSDEATAALSWREGSWLLNISLPNGDVLTAFTGRARVWPPGTTPVACGQAADGWVLSAGAQGTPGAPGTAFQIDAQGLFANRGAFDAEPVGFSYLAIDTGELYFREGVAGGWSAGVPFQGPPGDSAYQIAVANGFVGTEVEWLAALQGAAGDEGRGITSLAIDINGHLIVTYTDTTQADLGLVVGADGANGTNGTNGADGRGIASMAIDGSNHLIITYTDTTTEDAGLIPGAGGSAAWGSIGGTLADQADLQAALDGKASSAQGALADTAVQPATLTSALAGKVDVDGAKVLSDENYTSAEKSKLAGLESSRFKGLYASLAALQAAHPTAGAGDYADVDAGIGSDTVRYVWDVDDAQWIVSGSGAPLTAAQVKTLYESNPDTNAYTDSEKTKLAGVAAGATANSADATLLDRGNHTGSQATSTVTGLDAALAARALIAGLPSRDVTASGAVTPSDAGKWLICNSATPITLTIGAEATAAWTTSGILPMFHILQIGAGAVAVTGDGFSVTLHAGDTNVLDGPGAAATALWRASNTWSLIGRLVAA